MIEGASFSVTFPVFLALLVSGVGTLAWWLVQRQINKSDSETEKRDKFIDSKFTDHETRMNQHGDRLRQAEIELERKTTREELEKATDRMFNGLAELRSEIKIDIQQLSSAVLAAVSRSRGE